MHIYSNTAEDIEDTLLNKIAQYHYHILQYSLLDQRDRTIILENVVTTRV